MVFKLLLVILVLLVLGSSAQRTADHLNRWDLYNYNFVKDFVYKRDSDNDSDKESDVHDDRNNNKHDRCPRGSSPECKSPAVTASPPFDTSPNKRVWGKIGLITLIRLLSHDERSGFPIMYEYVPDQLANQPDK